MRELGFVGGVVAGVIGLLVIVVGVAFRSLEIGRENKKGWDSPKPNMIAVDL